MKIFPWLAIFLSTQLVHAQPYQQIHDKAILVDSHNDILMKAVDLGLMMDHDLKGKAHSDLPRWQRGGLDVQLFSVYCDGDEKAPYQIANREMDSLDAVVARNPDKIVKVSNYKELLKAVRQQKIAAMFGVEGGHMIEDDLTKLEALYKRGARYLTLTHNIAPSWATSAADETATSIPQGGSGYAQPLPVGDSIKKLGSLQSWVSTMDNPPLGGRGAGLKDFGKQVVKRMNELGMMIDLSHAGEQTFWDVMQLTTKPVIASHSSVYALTPHRRNLKDDQIKAIAKNGGVIQVNFNPGFIDSTFQKKETAFLKMHAAEKDSLIKAGMRDFYATDYLYHKYAAEVQSIRPPLSKLIDHIDYIVKLVGVDYVGLGSDFDGINATPQELDDVTSYPLITKALYEKGYSKKDITKILGGNLLRVLKAAENH